MILIQVYHRSFNKSLHISKVVVLAAKVAGKTDLDLSGELAIATNVMESIIDYKE